MYHVLKQYGLKRSCHFNLFHIFLKYSSHSLCFRPKRHQQPGWCRVLWKGADFLSNLNLLSAVFQTLLKHWNQQRAILVNPKQHQQSDSSLLSGFKRVVLVLLSVFFKPCSSIQVNPKQHQQSDRSLLSEHCSVSSLPSILLFHTHPLILQPECKCMLDKQNS